MKNCTRMQISLDVWEAELTSVKTTQVQRASAVQVQIQAIKKYPHALHKSRSKLSRNIPMPPVHISTCIFVLCHNFFDN